MRLGLCGVLVGYTRGCCHLAKLVPCCILPRSLAPTATFAVASGTTRLFPHPRCSAHPHPRAYALSTRSKTSTSDHRVFPPRRKQKKQYVANIATQCRECFYFGEKSNADLTLDGGGTTQNKPRRPSGTVGGGGREPPAGPGTETAGDGTFGSGGGVFLSAGTGSAGGARVAGDGGSSKDPGWQASPAPDAHTNGDPATVTPNHAVLGGGGAAFAGGESDGQEGGGDGEIGAGAGSGDGGGGSASSLHPRRQEQTPMGSPMRGLPAVSGEQESVSATTPPRKPLQQQTPIGSPMRGLPAGAGEQKPSSAPYPPRKPMQQQTPIGTPMRGLPPSGGQNPASATTPLRKPTQRQTPIGTPMRGLPPSGDHHPTSATTPLRRPMQQQTPIGSPMKGPPASGEQKPVSATSTPMQQGAQDARPPMPDPRPRLEQRPQQQQQPGGMMSPPPAFARVPPQLLQQTPTRGLVFKTQVASGRANGDGGEDGLSSQPTTTSRPPTVGAANARHSFPRTASTGGNGIGSGFGSVGVTRKNSSQFAILTESALASEEEDEPDSPVHNPAETPVGASTKTTAAPVGPRRSFRRSGSPDHSASRSSPSSNGRAGVSAAPARSPAGSLTSSVTGALARNFSMKNRRVQEDTAPKRRSKPRPGRGRGPHAEAPPALGAFSSNPLSETAADAAV